MAIRSFACAQTQALFHQERPRGIPPAILRPAMRKLLMIHAATDIADLRVPPGNRLEKLAGDRAGQWSIRVNDQWRICFTWRAKDAFDVEIVDYH